MPATPTADTAAVTADDRGRSIYVTNAPMHSCCGLPPDECQCQGADKGVLVYGTLTKEPIPVAAVAPIPVAQPVPVQPVPVAQPVAHGHQTAAPVAPAPTPPPNPTPPAPAPISYIGMQGGPRYTMVVNSDEEALPTPSLDALLRADGEARLAANNAQRRRGAAVGTPPTTNTAAVVGEEDPLPAVTGASYGW